LTSGLHILHGLGSFLRRLSGGMRSLMRGFLSRVGGALGSVGAPLYSLLGHLSGVLTSPRGGCRRGIDRLFYPIASISNSVTHRHGSPPIVFGRPLGLPSVCYLALRRWLVASLKLPPRH
jgi:hypothetical protein